MTVMGRLGLALAASAAFLAAGWSEAAGQEPRLRGRLAEPYRAQVDAILDSAAAQRLPTEPLVDRALEGITKGADGERIVRAVRRLGRELAAARDALGPRATAAEIVSGASALRAGAAEEDLARLRVLRDRRSVTVAAGTLADLVAVGVPPDTAVAAVLALAASVDDAEYVAFRQNVERDIALGASPVAALGARLAADGFAAASTLESTGPQSERPPPRKP